MRTILALFFICLTLLPVHAEDNLVVKQSAHNVGETLDRLEAILKERGLTIFARIDHAAGAKKAGMEMKPTELLVFGNPKMGTPLMQSNRRVGIDLPIKVLAWQDEKDAVWIAYNDPAYLKSRHAISDRDAVFGKMAGALGKLTDLAAARTTNGSSPRAQTRRHYLSELWVLPQSVWRRGSIRALSSSGPALPYIARLRVFRRLICPSAWPLLQGNSIAFRTASISRCKVRAKRMIGMMFDSIALSIHASSGADCRPRKDTLEGVLVTKGRHRRRVIDDGLGRRLQRGHLREPPILYRLARDTCQMLKAPSRLSGGISISFWKVK